ncbi:hypothetical protein [Nocardioides sp.]|uniref:hypothetical protein n=1 Tax=Nocardioides sp. TaxID=35761 RepID=UPI0026044E20|nr:hypothetical protein [Nocardioides sp.]
MSTVAYWTLAIVLVLAFVALWGVIWWLDSRHADSVAQDATRWQRRRRPPWRRG